MSTRLAFMTQQTLGGILGCQGRFFTYFMEQLEKGEAQNMDRVKAEQDILMYYGDEDHMVRLDPSLKQMNKLKQLGFNRIDIEVEKGLGHLVSPRMILWMN